MGAGSPFFLSLDEQRRYFTQEARERGSLLASGLALSAHQAVIGRDLPALKSLIRQVRTGRDVAYAFIIDQRDFILMHSDVTKISMPFSPQNASLRTGAPEGAPLEGAPLIEASEAIRHGGRVIGTAVVGISPESIGGILKGSRDRLLGTAALALVFGVVGTTLLTRRLLKPAADLDRGMEEITSGNLDVTLPPRGQDELGRLSDRFNRMADQLRSGYEEMERGHLEMVRALAAAIDEKGLADGHSRRVSAYAVEVGRRLGLSGPDLKELRWAATLHDIGRVGVKGEILSKPGRLSPEEERAVQRHSQIGQRVLERVESLRSIGYYILCHHEFLDGSGYPQGLKGEKIPLISRIITVADAYESMSSHRPYRRDLSEEEVRRRLLAGKGHQFDPLIVETFLQLCEEGVVKRL